MLTFAGAAGKNSPSERVLREPDILTELVSDRVPRILSAHRFSRSEKLQNRYLSPFLVKFCLGFTKTLLLLLFISCRRMRLINHLQMTCSLSVACAGFPTLLSATHTYSPSSNLSTSGIFNTGVSERSSPDRRRPYLRLQVMLGLGEPSA